MEQAAQIKLHIGCGDKKRSGFTNIDVRETSATDMVSEAWDLRAFDDGIVDEIYSRHMIEHLHPKNVRMALSEWYRVLKPRGVLHIICPDLEFHCKQYLGLIDSCFHNQREHALASIYGWRSGAFGGEEFDLHRWGYDLEDLSNLMGQSGFALTERVREGEDSEPWHLNAKYIRI
ncbi:class I SAM-dependent methyltransferase [Methylorubrum sp. GM97]|uniref:class I SAM-dependent methyltransferase n=1 Tax=Methylorubrum sp. GM97 TaxID=2938232 RepID=UPI0021C47F46|nr:methyltransferase domain-containing protein [Methylorubrum sp. GM97]